MGRKNKRKVNPAPLIEALEPRILFSADAFGAALDFDSANDPLADALEQARLEYDRTVAESQKAETLKAAQQKLQDDSTARTLLDDDAALSGDNDSIRDSGTKELVLVDTDTPDYELLVDDLLKNSGDRALEIILLDNSIDGIAQVNAILANYAGLDALHIISHGEDGAIDLGSSRLDQQSLQANSGAIAAWANAFSSEADILIYGCNLAATSTGEGLVDALSALTSTDVAASDDLTGSAALGGDWDFEYTAGSIETSISLSVDVQHQWAALLATPDGNEIDVNTTTTDIQTTRKGFASAESVAMDANGNSIVVWQSNGQDGDAQGVYATRFDADGNALDVPGSPGITEFLVNTTTASNQQEPTVAMDDAGNYVIVWTGNGTGDSEGIFFRRYDAAGNALDATEQLVNTTVSGQQRNPAVAMDADGDFVIAWAGEGTGDTDGIFYRRFDASGTAQDVTEVRVNTVTDQEQRLPAVAMDDAGNFVVSWDSDDDAGSGVDYNVYFQQYTAAGATQGSNTQVNVNATTMPELQQNSSIAIDGAGNFIISWESDDDTSNSDDFNIYFKQYDSLRNVLTSETLVNTNTAEDQIYSSIAATDDGRFSITWTSDDDGSNSVENNIYVQDFTSSGATIGSETLVNTTTSLDQSASSVAMSSTGEYLIAWNGNGPGDADGIFGRQFLSSNSLVVDTNIDYNSGDARYGDTSSIDALLNNKGTDGLVSLREAIDAANNTVGDDTVYFNIAGTGTHTISLVQDLSFITDTITIDATTESDYSNTPLIELDGGAISGSTAAFRIVADDSVIRGFSIYNFGDEGIEIFQDLTYGVTSGSNNTIEDNYIGLRADGTTVDGVTGHGVLIADLAANNMVRNNVIVGSGESGIQLGLTGGSGSTDGNKIQGNIIGLKADGSTAAGNATGITVTGGSTNNIIGTDGDSSNDANEGNTIAESTNSGIYLNGSSSTTIAGNYIGTDVGGTLDRGNNDFGIELNLSDSNIIGGATADHRNVIAANSNSGISIWNNTSFNNIVQGNYIGVDATGSNPLGNKDDGIVIGGGAYNNTIGGDRTAGEGNVISGNTGTNVDGIEIYGSGTTGNKVYGNYIGTNFDGSAALGNARYGVVLYDGAQFTEIGGTGTGEGNIISGNNINYGIVVDGANLANTHDNTIQANIIGLGADGVTVIANAGGIFIQQGAYDNTVGGNSAAARNVISGNNGAGIYIADNNTDGNKIQGNYIGTDAGGTLDKGNTSNNVNINSGASNNIVGGGGANEGNIIAYGGNDGITIWGGATTGNIVQGNAIGTNFAGTLNMGNTGDGIVISGGSNDNLIGGTGANDGNIVFNNGDSGIEIRDFGTVDNSVLGNRTYSNTGQGIELGSDNAVTPNDTNDSDNGESNDEQNFPVLSQADLAANQLTLSGTLDASSVTGAADYRIEFFGNAIGDQDTNNGEGRVYLGSTTLTTNGSGDGSFSGVVINGVTLVPGDFVTATATLVENTGQVGVDDLLAYGNTSEFSVNMAMVDANTAPTDLRTVAAPSGGVDMNNDGGNDIYFVADNGGALLGGLNKVTIESTFSINTPGTDLSPLFSYADGTNDEELALFLKSDGRIWFGASSNGSPIQSTTGFYTQLFDGEKHHVAVSWDNTTGNVDFYIDGVLEESFTGYQVGQTLTGAGELVFGQDQDSELGGFNTIDVFSGTMYDVRVFSDIRTAGEIGSNFDQALPGTEPGMIANWVFDNLSVGGVITDTVSGNNLTEQHVSGGGFTTSTPELALSIAESSADLTVVGSVAAIDPNSGDTFSYALLDDAGGRFDINSSNGEIFVLDGSLLDFESATSHNVTVEVTDFGGLTYSEVFTIAVTDGNDAAIAADDAYSVDEDLILTANWYDTDWTARRVLTLNNLAQTETLLDFPVLVKLNSGNIDYAKTKNDGSDLRFFAADGEALAYEIDSWNELGDSFVWVKVPVITGASNSDTVTMYYGNAAAIDGQDSGAVWANGYAGVWHLGDDPSLGTGAIDDSTINPIDGTTANMDGSNQVAGKVGGALAFDGSSEAIRLDSTDTDKLAITGNELTIEAWVKRDGTTGSWQIMVGRQIGTTSADAYFSALRFDNPNIFQFGHDGSSAQSTAVVTDATWKYLTAVQDGTDLLLYSDGVLVGSTTGAGAISTDDNDVIIGGAENDGTSAITEFFKGILDEVRMSGVARSADWIAAQYASMNDTFISFGSEQPAPVTDGLLSNDTDANNDALSTVLVSGPSDAASFSLNKDGTFSYTPNSEFSGVDTFTYKVNDGSVDSNVATVTITVNNVNDAPLLADGNLAATYINNANPNGQTITAIFNSGFVDPDTGSSLAGLAVVGNTANAGTEGIWEYSSDAGVNWYAIGSVDDAGNALALDAATVLRFVPVLDFSGSPTELGVRALDNSYTGPFTTSAGSEVRATITTTPNGGSTPIENNTTLLSTSISDEAPSLWLSTIGDDNSSGFGGLSSVEDSDVLAFSNPNLALGDVTTGTASKVFNLDAFTGDEKLNALHYVQTSLTLGGTSFASIDVSHGDVIFSIEGTATLTSGASSVSVDAKDVVLFSPDTPSDYSSGTFTVLLNNPAAGANIRGISLIESDTVVGDTTVYAGDFLFVSSGGTDDQQARLFAVDDVGDGINTVGTLGVLLDGDDINVGANNKWFGIHLVSNNTTIGGANLTEGQILVSVDAAETVGTNNLSVEEYDIFALTITKTTIGAGVGNGEASASMLLDGSDVGLTSNNESIVAIALAHINTAPTDIAATTTAIDENTNTTGGYNLGALTSTDPDTGDTAAYSIAGGADAAKFTLGGAGLDELILDDGMLDFESKPSYSVTIRVTDSVGNTYDETLTITVNNLNDAPVATEDRTRLDFDGVDDYVLIGDSASLTMTNTMTMEAWIQPDASANAYQMIMNKEGEYEVALLADGSLVWSFGGSDPAWGWNNTGYIVADDEWAHIAITYDNGTVLSYVNGSLVHTYSGSGPIGDSNGPMDTFRIGSRENAPAGQYFDGKIDDVRVWNTARTQDEIQANLDANLAGNETGLAGYWKFDEGSGTAANDLTANANHGTLTDGAATGAPLWSNYATDQNTPYNVLAADGVLANDIDADGNSLTVTKVNGAAVGPEITLLSGAKITMGSAGDFSYNPSGAFDYLDLGESAVDSFIYEISDGNGGTDTAFAYITITGINDDPTAGTIADFSVPEDTATSTIDLKAIFEDAEDTDTELVYSIESNSNTGLFDSVTINASKIFILDYAANQNGFADITLRATDTSGQFVETSFRVTVDPVNDAPVLSVETGDSVAESLTETNTTLSVSDTVTVTDIDLTDLVSSSVLSVVESGDTSGIANGTLLAMMSITGDLDATETTEALAWAFNSGAETFDYLEAGQTLTLTYTVEVDDGSAQDTQTIVITINGSNDAPVLSVESGDSVAETLTETNTTLAVSDTVTVTDIDLTDLVSSSVLSVVETGDTSGIANATLLSMMSITGDLDATETTEALAWAFNSGAESFDYLEAGQTLTLTYTVEVDDGTAQDTQTIVITINGSNDAPVLSVETGDSVAETLTETNTTLSVSDTVTVTDVDLTDSVSSSVTTVVESGDTSGIANGTLLAMMSITGDLDATETTEALAWAFNSGAESFNYLEAGQTLTLTYTVEVDDGSAQDTQTIVITINGSNDAPVLSVETGDSVAETLTETNTTLSVSDTVTVTDVDLTDLVSSSVISVVESGDTSGIANGTLLAMMSITGDLDATETTEALAWAFNSGAESFDYLEAGQTLTLTYTVEVDDGSAQDTQTIVITINGSNDAPVLSVETGDSVAETLTETNTTLSVSDTVTVTDVDLTDLVSSSVISVVESGDTSGIANGTLLAMMSITGDLDATETSEALAWAFNSGAETFDYLEAGQTLTLTYTVEVDDGSAQDTQTIVITINGSNDAPVLSVESGDSVAETLTETNTTLAVSDTVTVTDIDLTDLVSSSVLSVVETGDTSGIANATLLSMMSITGDLDATETTEALAWAFNSGAESFDYLEAGQTLTLTYTVEVDDGSAQDTQTIVITINGSNDAPVLSVETGDSVAETLTETNTTLVVSDTVTVTDIDLTDLVSSSVLSVVESGDTSGIANGTLLAMMSITGDLDATETSEALAWAFNSGAESFDYLEAGQTLTLTYTIEVDDGTAQDTQNIVITINGSNDAPVLSVETGDSVAETLTETNTTLAVSDTVTVTDIDLTDLVSSSVLSVVESGDTSGIANGTLLSMMSITGDLDATETTEALAWAFNSGAESFNYLEAGQTLTLTYTVEVDDGSAQDTQTIVITINGSNDAPVLSVETGDSVAETLTETNTTLAVSDTVTVTDIDLTDLVSSSVLSVVETGDTSGIANATLLSMMSITGDLDATETTEALAWAFNSGAESFDYLEAGQTLTLTYTVEVDDGTAQDTQTIVITINGSNDAPVLSVETGDSVAETLTETNTTLSVSDTVTVTDVDLTDSVSSSVTTVVESGDTSGIANGTLLAMMSITGDLDATETSEALAWAFNSGAESFNYLEAGQTLTLTYTVEVDDGSAQDTQTIVITINGSNDAPVLSVETGDSVAETLTETNTTLSVSDTITVTDVDVTDLVSSSVISVVESGDTSGIANGTLLAMMSITGDLDATETSEALAWAFNSGAESFNYLEAGQTLTLTYTVEVDDGSAQDTQTIVITINGSNDAPVLSAGSAVTYTEGTSATPFSTATVNDVDSPDFDGGVLTYSITSGGDGLDTLLLGSANGVTTAGTAVFVSGTYVGEQAGGNAGSPYTITFNSDATIARVEAVFQTLTIASNDDNPSTGVRNLSVTISDGDGDTSNTATATADLTTIYNDDPFNAGLFPSDIVVLEDTLSNLDLSVINFSDPDANAGLLTVSLTTSTGGELTLAAGTGITVGGSTTAATVSGTVADLNAYFDNTANIQYLHATPNFSGSNVDTVNVTVQDNFNTGVGGGGVINLGTANIDITGDNDAPVLSVETGDSVAETLTETNTTLSVNDTVTVTDVDVTDLVSASITTVVESGNASGIANGTLLAMMNITGDLDATETTEALAWSFNSGAEAFDYLDAGETLTLTYTVEVDDGTAQDIQTIVITINGTEDAPVLGTTNTGSVFEDGVLIASDTLTITDADTSDNPISFNDQATVPGTNGYGTFAMTGNTWTYTLNNNHASVQALDVTETLTDTFTFTATDGTPQTVTVTINGAEDAPVLGTTNTGTVTEDGVLVASDTLTITDVDTNDNPISFNDQATIAGTNGFGTFAMTSNTWTYTLTNAHAMVQALDVTESLTDTFTFTATDGTMQTVTVTINGAEDAPTLDNAIADQGATEDSPFSFTFNANTFSDVDTSDTLTYTATLSGGGALPGWLSFNAATRTFSGTPLNADVGMITIDVIADDGTSSITDTFTLTVSNTNDAPVIGGVSTGNVTEDVDPDSDGLLEVNNALTIADPDTGESSFVADTINGAYGDLVIDTAGNWSYSADNTQLAIQSLDTTESVTDTLTVTTFDGSTHDVVITIYGAEDAPVQGGGIIGTVAEDGTLIASDTLTITDVDTSDNPISYNNQATIAGDNGYGTFAMAGNTWTYTLNNAHPAVQALDAGESTTDTFTFTANDGSTQLVTVTINGAEDASVQGGINTGSVNEDGTLSTGNTLTITDVDTSDNPVSYNDVVSTTGSNGYGDFAMTGNSWTYTVNNALTAIQSLDSGDAVTDSATFTTTDGKNQLVTVTINGAEDAPTASDNTITFNQGGTHTFAASDFGFADVDTGDTLASIRVTTLTTAGDLQLAGSNVALNQVINRADIDAGQLTFAPGTGSGTGYANFTFTVNDGALDSTSAQTLTFNINTLPDPDPDPDPDPEPEEETEITNVTPPAEPDPEPVTDTTDTPTDDIAPPALPITDVDANDIDLPEPLAIDVVVDLVRDTHDQGDLSASLPKHLDLNNLDLALYTIEDLQLLQQQTLFNNDDFVSALDNLSFELDKVAALEQSEYSLGAETRLGIAVSLSAGFVSWALRAGSLLASMFSVMPLWKQLDPLPIVSVSNEKEKELSADECAGPEEDELEKKASEGLSNDRCEDIFSDRSSGGRR